MAFSPPPIRTVLTDDNGILTYPWQRYVNDEYTAIRDSTGGGGSGQQGVTGLHGVPGSDGKPGQDGQPGEKGDQGVTGLAGLGIEADNLAYSWMLT
jgi:hypothetical protein